MRRFFMLAVALTSAALSSFGCDSDDSGGSNNGGSGGAPLAHCVGINSEFTPADFYAQAADDKACSSSSDLTSICANDLPRIGGMCGASCVTMSADAAGRAACNAECINDALTSAKAKPLSDECMACYTADIECAAANCLGECATAPASVECATCRVTKGCVAAFYGCSGLPIPTSPSGNGGEGGA